MLKNAATKMLHDLPLFSGLSEAEKNALIPGGMLRHLERGANLFLFGDPVTHYSLVCEGAVQLYRATPDGHELTAQVLLAGEGVGTAEIFQTLPTHQFNARAVKPTVVIEFPLAWIKEAARQHPALACNLLTRMAWRASGAAIEAEHHATMTAAQQVTCFFQRLCILHGLDPRGFDLPYSKTLIASRLGMELETFSRTLVKIREEGIAVRGNRVSFTNLEKVTNYACAHCSLEGYCHEHEALRQQLAADQTPPSRKRTGSG